MGQFNDWARRGRNFREGEEPEYYEDTHDSSGKYVASSADARSTSYYTGRNGEKSIYGDPTKIPDKQQYVAPRFYQNVVVYEPHALEDVQILIDYLRRREPAIINLNSMTDDYTAQRILDYLSGAEYALGGSVHPIADNIFLMTPEGVEISVPYDI